MEIISITIVAYKNYSDIIEAISSIEFYTKIKKIIYIIDNSEYLDSSIEVKEFKQKIKRFNDVVYINTHHNLGFGAGHNFVLSTLNSQYHAIVNPDIILKDSSFDKIVEFMDQNEEVGMTIPKIVSEDGTMQEVYRLELTVFDMFIRMFLKNSFKKRQLKHTMHEMNYNEIFDVPFGQGSFLVIRTDLFKKLNGFDDRFFMYLEDADLCKRVNQVSKLVYFPNTEVIHKWEKGSHKNKKLFKIHIESMIKYFNKWGWKLF